MKSPCGRRLLPVAAACVLAACGWLAGGAARAETAVNVVLVTQPGFSPSWQRDWYDLFIALKVDNLQIRTLSGSEKPLVEQLGTDAAPRYRVTGVLTPNNELLLPGGRFTARDRTGVSGWLKKLREGGPAVAQGAPALPFNLSRDELKSVQQELAKPVGAATKDLNPREAVDKIAAQLTLPLVADRTVADKLAQGAGFGDELEGVSAGAALACVLRPQGLVLVPTRDAKRQLQLSIVPSKGATETWPVGWPPEKPDPQVLPELFENLNVEVDQIPLRQVLSVIGERLKTPVLYDHNALARHAIDPAQVKVSLPAGKTAYVLALKKLLAQGKLKYELRVDEAQKPLLWITTTLP